MIEDAFTYPVERDDWVKTVLIGGVLTFLGFLLIPLFVVYGYVVRAIRTSIDGDTEPPAFEDWGTLLVTGFQAWLIGVIYLLIPAIVAFVTIGGSIMAMATGGDLGAGVGVAGLFGGLAVTFVLSLVFGYLSVGAIVLFARQDQFGAAFDFGQLRDLVLTTDYAIAWVVAIVVFIVAGIVASIPLIGFIIGPFATFFAAVIAARLWAGGYIDAMDNDTQASATAP